MWVYQERVVEYADVLADVDVDVDVDVASKATSSWMCSVELLQSRLPLRTLSSQRGGQRPHLPSTLQPTFQPAIRCTKFDKLSHPSLQIDFPLFCLFFVVLPSLVSPFT